MGNGQSSGISPEAREAEERAAEARRAAFNADMDRRKEEAKKKTLVKMAERSAKSKDAIANSSPSADSSKKQPPRIEIQSPNSKHDIPAPTTQVSGHGSKRRTVEIESESENEWTPAVRKRAKKGRQRKPAPALYKATVKNLADSGIVVTGSTADVDTDMMLRIKKCIDRANHPNTPETEAKRALYLASRLMAQYNVSQAEVLAHEPPEVQRQYSGQSVVSITRIDGDETKPVRENAFVNDVCYAMELFFNCQFYSTSFDYDQSYLDFTFYGIAENTVAAAMAFEMTYNLISEWARPYKGVGGKNSYSLGVGAELYNMAEEAREAEEEEARKLEKQEADEFKDRIGREEDVRQAELDRLAASSGEPNSYDLPSGSKDGAAKGNAFNGGTPASGLSTNPIWLDSDSDSDDQDDDDDENEEITGYNSGLGIDRDDDEDIYVPDFKIETQNEEAGGELDAHVDQLLDGETPGSHGLAQGPGRAFSDRTSQESDKPTNGETGPEARWTSHMQLVTFRKTAQSVAEEHLKKQGVKLSKNRKRDINIRDRSAYDQGVKDGRKIDVHRRTIKE